MKTLNLRIRNNIYQINCDPGHEDALKSLALELDSIILESESLYGSVNDKMLFILNLLTFLDQIKDLKKENQYLKSFLSNKDFSEESNISKKKHITEMINSISNYLESIANKIEKS